MLGQRLGSHGANVEFPRWRDSPGKVPPHQGRVDKHSPWHGTYWKKPVLRPLGYTYHGPEGGIGWATVTYLITRFLHCNPSSHSTMDRPIAGASLGTRSTRQLVSLHEGGARVAVHHLRSGYGPLRARPSSRERQPGQE